MPVIIKAQDISLPVDSATHMVTYQGVVELKGSKPDLYSKGLEWMALTFNKNNYDIIQIQDKDLGKLAGRWAINTFYGNVTATIMLLFKGNKYKYIITELYYTNSIAPSKGGCNFEADEKMWNKITWKYVHQRVVNETVATIENTVTDLNKLMSAPDKPQDF